MRKLILAVFFLSACASSNRLNRLSLGMDKSEVLKIMGSPTATSAHEKTEYLTYDLIRPGVGLWPYFVRLKEGKVDAYGMVGDFNTTRNAGVDVNVNSAPPK